MNLNDLPIRNNNIINYLNNIDLNTESKIPLFKSIKNYYYWGSHGFIDKYDPELTKTELKRTPRNVSIVFLSSVGTSICDNLNINTIDNFYKKKNMLNKFRNNLNEFVTDSKLRKGLRKSIIIPPSSIYLDLTLEIFKEDKEKQWETEEFGLFKLPLVERNKKHNLLFSGPNKYNPSKIVKNEIHVKLSQIINTYLNNNKSDKGGIIFIDTCRSVWTNINSVYKANSRTIRETGNIILNKRLHNKYSNKYTQLNQQRGRLITNKNGIQKPCTISNVNKTIKTGNNYGIPINIHIRLPQYKILKLDNIIQYKIFEENRSKTFKLLFSKNSITESKMKNILQNRVHILSPSKPMTVKFFNKKLGSTQFTRNMSENHSKINKIILIQNKIRKYLASKKHT